VIATIKQVGYRHSKDDILEAAVAAVFDDGLSQLSFGNVARRLGISDRVVVYYFPSKDDLIGEVLVAVGEQLQAALAPAFAKPAADHVEMLRVAWPVLARPEVDPVFALFFEASGLAATGREPYRTLVGELMQGWTLWVQSLLAGTPAQRRAEATAAMATIDGLLLMRQVVGSEAADVAARRIVRMRRGTQGSVR
jgi:AcrR family transcriptional regulator